MTCIPREFSLFKSVLCAHIHTHIQQQDREEDEMPLYSLGSLTREKEMEEALLHYTSTVSYKNVSSFAKPIRYFGKQVSLEKSNLCCSTDNFSLSFFSVEVF